MHYTICTHCVPHLGCIFLRAVSDHGIRIGFADEVGFDELLGLHQLDGHDAAVVGVCRTMLILYQAVAFIVFSILTYCILTVKFFTLLPKSGD